MPRKKEFVLTDGVNFIKKDFDGKYKQVHNLLLADIWDNQKVAKAILENSIPRAWSQNFYIAKCENGEIEKVSLSHNEHIETKREITAPNSERKDCTLDLYSFNDDESVQGLISGFEQVNEVLKRSQDMENKLKKDLMTLDYMFEDLKHYHLKRNLGTVDAYKRDKLESEVLLTRASVKIQLEIIHKINQYNSDISSKVKDICETINSVRNRTYIPRVLIDLFENNNLDIKIV